MTVLIGAVAGSLGAVARYLVSGAIQTRTRSAMPLGTAAVNLVGAFIVGLVIGVDTTPTGWLLAVSGFAAGFTTFSTWMVETARLGLFPRPSARAVVNLVVMTVLGIACIAIGYYVTN
ncbi:MAG: CrcB family protein [Acidimicrobiia bacterium]